MPKEKRVSDEPTKEQLSSPEFQAIWRAIKTWDINVPESYEGYCGATGSHVATILNALQATPPDVRVGSAKCRRITCGCSEPNYCGGHRSCAERDLPLDDWCRPCLELVIEASIREHVLDKVTARFVDGDLPERIEHSVRADERASIRERLLGNEAVEAFNAKRMELGRAASNPSTLRESLTAALDTALSGGGETDHA